MSEDYSIIARIREHVCRLESKVFSDCVFPRVIVMQADVIQPNYFGLEADFPLHVGRYERAVYALKLRNLDRERTLAGELFGLENPRNPDEFTIEFHTIEEANDGIITLVMYPPARHGGNPMRLWILQPVI